MRLVTITGRVTGGGGGRMSSSLLLAGGRGARFLAITGAGGATAATAAAEGGATGAGAGTAIGTGGVPGCVPPATSVRGAFAFRLAFSGAVGCDEDEGDEELVVAAARATAWLTALASGCDFAAAAEGGRGRFAMGMSSESMDEERDGGRLAGGGARLVVVSVLGGSAAIGGESATCGIDATGLGDATAAAAASAAFLALRLSFATAGDEEDAVVATAVSFTLTSLTGPAAATTGFGDDTAAGFGEGVGTGAGAVVATATGAENCGTTFGCFFS